MTEQEAIGAATQALPAHKAPPEAAAQSAELRWVELKEGDPAVPGPVRDAKAWVVRFAVGERPVVELTVEDRTREVVRGEWFR